MDSSTSTYHQKRGHMFILEHSVVHYRWLAIAEDILQYISLQQLLRN